MTEVSPFDFWIKYIHKNLDPKLRPKSAVGFRKWDLLIWMSVRGDNKYMIQFQA